MITGFDKSFQRTTETNFATCRAAVVSRSMKIAELPEKIGVHDQSHGRSTRFVVPGSKDRFQDYRHDRDVNSIRINRPSLWSFRLQPVQNSPTSIKTLNFKIIKT